MKYLILSLALVFLLSCSQARKQAVANGTQDSGESAVTPSKKESRKLPGLMPVDVYINMEKKGFKTTKSFSQEYGNLWDSKYEAAGISYSVSTFSKDASSVESVSATASLTDVQNKTILATKQFFLYLSSLPYDGSNPSMVAAWLNQNFDNNKASVTISMVTFTIFAPTKFARILTIEPAN